MQKLLDWQRSVRVNWVRRIAILVTAASERATLTSARTNGVLAALSSQELKRLCGKLELVNLACGQILYESGRPQEWAYFPTTAKVAMNYPLKDGLTVEIAVVGSEGLIGTTLFLGGVATLGFATVQAPGQAYRLSAQAVAGETEAVGSLLKVVLHYAQAHIALLMQIAACNRYHSIEQHLCCWLLLTRDRLGGDELAISQNQIALKLGVRRGSVSDALAKLRADGLIRCIRGHTTFLDRSGIEKRACECYVRGKADSSRLLPRQRAR